MDIDTEGPVASAVVKVARIQTGPQHVGRAVDGSRGTTDEYGFFSFTAEVPGTGCRRPCRQAGTVTTVLAMAGSVHHQIMPPTS